MLKTGFFALVVGCGMFSSAAVLADEIPYTCGLAQEDQPAEPSAQGQFTGAPLTLRAAEYIGVVKQDPATSALLLAIFYKADENAAEESLAIGSTELGAKHLYLIAYHGGKQIAAICDKN